MNNFNSVKFCISSFPLELKLFTKEPLKDISSICLDVLGKRIKKRKGTGHKKKIIAKIMNEREAEENSQEEKTNTENNGKGKKTIV